MTAAGPSVFLLMVNGQVESAQVSGRGPRPPYPTLPGGPSRDLQGCRVAPERCVVPPEPLSPTVRRGRGTSV